MEAQKRYNTLPNYNEKSLPLINDSTLMDIGISNKYQDLQRLSNKDSTEIDNTPIREPYVITTQVSEKGHFKLILAIVSVCTISSLLFAFVLMLMQNDTNKEFVQGNIDKCFDLTKVGFGAIVGLFGGKAASN